MRIIVNADDLGDSPKVNAAIFALMAAGRIRSATIIPNGRAFEEAVARSREFPDCSFGIHLNAASGPPVGNPAAAQPLLGPDGCLRLDAVRRVFLSGRTRAAVLAEWRAQVERVRSAGVRLSHMDSHEHLHTVPALFGVLKRLQRETGITRVRLARCRRGQRTAGARAVCLGRAVWNRALRMDGTRTADLFCSLPEFNSLPPAKRDGLGTVEIMVHAGTPAAGEDARLLESDWWSGELRRHPMISYAEL